MKLSCIKVLFFLVFLFLPIFASGQVNPLKDKKIQRKEAKIERQRKLEYKRAREKALKERFEMQTKKVQERMKASKKEASKFYKKESFFKKIFRKIKKIWKG